MNKKTIEQLKAIDTPTVCNAIETFEVRGRMDGFMGMDIRCLLPQLGTMVGYAVTVTVDSTTPDVGRDPEVWRQWMEAMEAAPDPVVLVFKDVGPQPRKSAHIGEVMATLAMRLGVVGLVSDGGVRDMKELEGMGLHCFAPGIVPSHGNPRLLAVNVPVVIDGVEIRPNDLLHGDRNGLTKVPSEIAEQIPAAAAKVLQAEAELISYIKSDAFTVPGLYERKFTH